MDTGVEFILLDTLSQQERYMLVLLVTYLLEVFEDPFNVIVRTALAWELYVKLVSGIDEVTQLSMSSSILLQEG